MSKVELTREQAKSLERLRDHWSDDEIISKVVKGKIFEQHYNNVFETFASELSIKKIVHVFKYGYEIKEEFKVGDWVKANWRLEKPTIHKLKGIDRNTVEIDGEQNNTNPGIGIISLATPEEIAEEKERRWWAKHGRDVWELKEFDELRDVRNDCRYTVSEEVNDVNVGLFDTYIDYKYFTPKKIKENFLVVCFVEERKDL